MRRIWFCLSLAVVASHALAASSFVYKTGSGVQFEVTASGLSSIHIGKREIATGSWSAFNAENWFKDGGSGNVKFAKPTEQSLEILSPTSARVRQRLGEVTTIADYHFDGEDVTISTRLENANESSPLNVVGFSGLRFNFDSLPAGEMLNQHISYFQAHGLELCHPLYWSPIGGSFAIDSSAGVGVSPVKCGLARTLILWDFVSWEQDQRDKVPSRNLIYFANIPVPARGAATVDLCLRVSPNRDWHYLLAPYRDHFRKTFGAVQYHADDRWIATDYLNKNREAISPANPYGFFDGYRRIDTAEGAQALCNKLIPAIRDGGGQGLIVWGQGGEDPRGGMYRPDFDVLPPGVDANFHIIADQFAAAGLKIGVCTRPRDMAVRQDFSGDQIISINPDDPGHRAMLLARFNHMIKRGCKIFYLDSFGDSLEDVKLMQFLRKELGPDVLTYCEHQCDAIMPYSGGYSETTASSDGYRLWSGLDRWEIYQYLCPGSQMAARLYEIKKPLPEQNPDEWYLSHQITPLVPVNDFARLGKLKEFQAKSLTADHHWMEQHAKE
jgi:hypothetical protein